MVASLRTMLAGYSLALLAFAAVVAADVGSDAQYLIASFPGAHWLQYIKMGDPSWRPLVIAGINDPKAMAIDEATFKLYVVDRSVLTIFWYQLAVLPNGKLITDGRQHKAVTGVDAQWVAVNGNGDLYFSGKLTPPIPQPTPSYDAIYFHSAIAMATGDTINVKEVWTRANSGSEKKVWTPGGLAMDAFQLYFANREAAKMHGTVVKASMSPPDVEPENSILTIADNSDVVFDIALSSTSLFYGTSSGVYGISKSKATSTCGTTNCNLVSELPKKATSLFWDGDGTIYVADNGLGGIYTFPSGSPQKHKLTKVIDAPGVWGASMLILSSGVVARTLPLFAALVSLLAPQLG